jgi:hypothetical protein
MFTTRQFRIGCAAMTNSSRVTQTHLDTRVRNAIHDRLAQEMPRKQWGWTSPL